MNILEILFGQIPEAIYFALFMIYTKRLKRKRILFTVLTTIAYIILLNILPFSNWAHILYFIMVYMTIKILYKRRSQITDFFTLGIASISIIIISLVTYTLCLLFTKNYMVAIIVNRICLFIVLHLMRNRLYKIQNMYKLLWNRNDTIPKPMKSITFRCINLLIFNLMFYAINVCILYCLYKRG